MNKKKGEPMADAAIKTPDLPQSEELRMVQAQVNKTLFDEVIKEAKRVKPKKQKIREIVEWGLQAWLYQRKTTRKAK